MKYKNISLKKLMSDLNTTSTEIIKIKKKIGITHKKIVFTAEEAKKIIIEYNKKNQVPIPQKEIKKMSNKDLNIIYYGPAGTGKTREALNKVEELTSKNYNKALLLEELEKLEDEFKEARASKATKLEKEINKKKEAISKLDEEKKTFYEFTTFHPSYQYQEFIEGITIREENKKTIYEIKDGIFKKIAKRALENLDKNYVLIIDEINRGNISSIFGEFFTLLEDTKRFSSTEEENSEAVSITLPYSQKKLSVPDNLYIIGTMNTTDKSISLLDVALRRRFKFIAVEPDYNAFENPNIDGLDMPNMLKSINERLVVLKGEDFQIGHSYFLKAKNIEDLQEIMEYKIIPLLKEYFHGDWESICAVLNQNYEAIGNDGLLVSKIDMTKDIFRNNSKFNEKIKRKKVCKLNPSFTIDDLSSII